MPPDQPIPEIIKRSGGNILIFRGPAGRFSSPVPRSVTPRRRLISAQEFTDCTTNEAIRDRFENLIREARLNNETLEFDALRLSGAVLNGLDIAGCTFRSCDFQGAILEDAVLNETDFSAGNCSATPLPEIKCNHDNYRTNDFGQARVKHAVLRQAVLRRSWLHEADFRFTDLTAADLRETCLTGAQFFGATLSLQTQINAEDQLYLTASCGGYQAERQNFSGANLVRAYVVQAKILSCNLSGARLRAAYFQGISLNGTTLEDADLSDATFEVDPPPDLRRVRLRGATLVGTSMQTAILLHADLRDANLAGANLRRANLLCADLTGAELSNADLSEAKVSPEQIQSARSRVGTKLPPAIEQRLREQASVGVIRAISRSRAR